MRVRSASRGQRFFVNEHGGEFREAALDEGAAAFALELASLCVSLMLEHRLWRDALWARILAGLLALPKA